MLKNALLRLSILSTVVPATLAILFWVNGPGPQGVDYTTYDAAGQVQTEVASIMEEADCWEEPESAFGRTAHSAIIKDDGTLRVRLVSIEVAWEESTAGRAWVMGQCAKKVR